MHASARRGGGSARGHVWSLLNAAALVAALLVAQAARAQPAASPLVGRWLIEGGDGIVEIAPCGSAICGRLVGMSSPFKADGVTPESDAHGVPMCRRTILHAMPAPEGRWQGTITDPETGNVWDCVLWVDAAGELHLRGFVLAELFGASQVWQRTNIVPAMDCTMPVR